jgi:hypothetical protein
MREIIVATASFRLDLVTLNDSKFTQSGDYPDKY